MRLSDAFCHLRHFSYCRTIKSFKTRFLDVLAARLENEQQGKSSALLRIQFN